MKRWMRSKSSQQGRIFFLSSSKQQCVFMPIWKLSREGKTNDVREKGGKVRESLLVTWSKALDESRETITEGKSKDPGKRCDFQGPWERNGKLWRDKGGRKKGNSKSMPSLFVNLYGSTLYIKLDSYLVHKCVCMCSRFLIIYPPSMVRPFFNVLILF